MFAYERGKPGKFTNRIKSIRHVRTPRIDFIRIKSYFYFLSRPFPSEASPLPFHWPISQQPLGRISPKLNQRRSHLHPQQLGTTGAVSRGLTVRQIAVEANESSLLLPPPLTTSSANISATTGPIKPKIEPALFPTSTPTIRHRRRSDAAQSRVKKL